MNESEITRDYKHWIEKQPINRTECFEIKIVKLDKQTSFAFNRVADHQIKGLLDSLEGFWFKIPDTSAINGFSAQKPFDVVLIKSYQAWVVVAFYSPRKFKILIKIPIKKFIELKNTWPRKSSRLAELEKLTFVEKIYL